MIEGFGSQIFTPLQIDANVGQITKDDLPENENEEYTKIVKEIMESLEDREAKRSDIDDPHEILPAHSKTEEGKFPDSFTEQTREEADSSIFSTFLNYLSYYSTSLSPELIKYGVLAGTLVSSKHINQMYNNPFGISVE